MVQPSFRFAFVHVHSWFNGIVRAESKAGTSFKRSVPAIPEFQIRTPADSGWTVFAASNYV
jgi:hypothetical protein